MKRAIISSLLSLAAMAALAAPAQADFGLSDFDVFFSKEEGSPIAATEAGSHPFSMTTSFGVNFTGEDLDAQPDGEIKDATFTQIPGLAINPTATPRCSTVDFLARVADTACPAETQVGETTVEAEAPGTLESTPVFNLAPVPGSAARLGFVLLGVPVVIDGRVKQTPPFNLIGALRNTRQVVKVFGAELTLFGTPEDVPFLTLPTSCEGPQATSYEALSWQGETDSGSVLTHDHAGNPQGFVGCGKLPFDPEIQSLPSSDDAGSSSGLRFELSFDQSGLTSTTSEGVQSAVKEAVVTLPEGITANPSLAEGLGVCSEADLSRETLAAGPGQGCPEASKVGTIEVRTPLLEDPLPGAVYVATPNDPGTAAPENPFDSLIALYIVVKDPNLGVLVKLPAEVTPDPETGRLITTVKDTPQIPFSSFSFRFREGQRAPLITPERCGTYTTEARFTPWARPNESVAKSASFQITSGPGGAPCPPAGAPPFDPGFQAGAANNSAAAYSPFLMRLTRRDGDQDLTKLAATLPPGVTGRLAGVDRCPDAQIAQARAKTGRAELASPSCPLGSRIGQTLGGAGVGAALTYVPGSLYLAGPHKGAPLSVVAITPAVAGPFDAGTVVVRVALRVDPITAQVKVDGSASDPIPHILAGIPLKLRELRVETDRQGFTLNPTSCDPFRTDATLWGSFLNVLSPADDVPVSRGSRYQAADCARLGFKPRLDLQLRGGTKRGSFPRLTTTYRPRPGDANLEGLLLRLPRSVFVEQGHFRTICTRVQFAAEACPKEAVYGHITAHTPLLDDPLQGPVYLRSSNNNLPDLVFDLHGLVDIEVATRIDSIRGGLRATVNNAPDAPITKVILNMQGGQKGLIVNSRNLCVGPNRATVALAAHSGASVRLRPQLRSRGCKGQRRSKRARDGGARR